VRKTNGDIHSLHIPNRNGSFDSYHSAIIDVYTIWFLIHINMVWFFIHTLLSFIISYLEKYHFIRYISRYAITSVALISFVSFHTWLGALG
jgi:hypothetical protein